MKEQTIAQKVLKKIIPIDKDKFIKGEYINEEQTKCCLVGHLNRLATQSKKYSILNCLGQNTKLAKDIIDSSCLYNKKQFDNHVSIVTINDGTHLKEEYPQENPKERVVAFLKDMIKAGY